MESLEEGLDTVIGEAGVRLSGGQRQRIGIARALYRKPEVLVLDEATSALDTETEAAVMQAIDSLQGKMTMLIIAHRLSTLKNCNYLMAIDNGELAEMGTAEQLMEKKGIYYRLWTLQNEQLQKVMEGR